MFVNKNHGEENMLVSFNPNVSYKQKQAQFKKQPSMSGLFNSKPICEAIHLDSSTIKFTKIPPAQGNRGFGVITELGDFITDFTRNPKYKGKNFIVDNKELEAACQQCQPPFFAQLLRNTFADQGVIPRNIS